MSSGVVKTKELLDRLEAAYLARKATIRADASLSWEKKELAIKKFCDEYHRARSEAEKWEAKS